MRVCLEVKNKDSKNCAATGDKRYFYIGCVRCAGACPDAFSIYDNFLSKLDIGYQPFGTMDGKVAAVILAISRLCGEIVGNMLC